MSSADVERWQAFGGKVQENKGRKVYIAPSGKKLKTWKEADRLMDREDDDKEGASAVPHRALVPAAVYKPFKCCFPGWYCSG